MQKIGLKKSSLLANKRKNAQFVSLVVVREIKACNTIPNNKKIVRPYCTLNGMYDDLEQE